MIHRQLKTIIDNGFINIYSDTSLLDEFIYNFNILPDEITRMKTYFSQNKIESSIGYPKVDMPFPIVAIILAGDTESEKVLGREMGQITDSEDDFFGSDFKGSIWDYHYNIIIATIHPDICAYIYELIKLIIISNIDTFINLGHFNINISGAELIPDTRYLPEHVFIRQLAFSCSSELMFLDKDSRLNKAFAVSGIHLDKEATLRDIGNVETEVKLYEE
jgi:hypothetical protein